MEDFEDQATQPATQPLMDPRRYGQNNSGLSEEDLSDVLCILHPASQAAFQVVETVARSSPQHILQNEDLLHHRDHAFMGADEVRAREDMFKVQRDIALRMSSSIKDLCSGFRFGRNAVNNDIVLGHDFGTRRISAMHFRIYLKDEVLMLEDSSTNGTCVDDIILMHGPQGGRRPRSAGGRKFDFGGKRMLNASSFIKIFSDVTAEEILFMVRFPPRQNCEELYLNNLHAYLDRIDTEALRRQRIGLQAKIPHELQLRGNGRDFAQPNPRLRVPVAQAAPNPFGRRGPITRTRLPRDWDGGIKYKVIGTAGKGAFAIVYKIAARSDGEIFAAKELDKRKFIRNGILDQKLDNEMKIMKRLRHPNIVQYHDYAEEGPYMYIIMEYVPGGDLGSIISQRGFIPEAIAKPMARQVFGALQYLHSCKITHRDIKPDNILIVQDDPIKVKLSDFGLSKVIDDQETYLRTFCGTLLYCAPEVFQRYPDYASGIPLKRRRNVRRERAPHTYNQACDLWSFAAVLFMALSGSPPFVVESGDRDMMLDKIMTTELDTTPLIRHQVSQEAISLVRRLLSTRPELRPMEEECLQDPWLAEPGCTMVMEANEQALSTINELEEQGLDASQLSLDDWQPSGGEDDDSQDDFDFDQLDLPLHQSKRVMTDEALALREPKQISSSPDPDVANAPVGVTRPGRLFGEVSNSVVASSGVMPGQRLNLDLESEDMDEDKDEDKNEDVEMHANQDPTDAFLNLDSEKSTLNREQKSNKFENTFEQAVAGELFDDSEQFASAQGIPADATSLLGADVLVGQLQVASPGRQTSRGSTPRSPVTPKTPASRDDSPRLSSFETADRDSKPDATKNPTPPKNLSRRITMPVPDSYYYDVFDKSTHNAQYAAKMRALEAAKGKSLGSLPTTGAAQSGLRPQAPERATSQPISALKTQSSNTRTLADPAEKKDSDEVANNAAAHRSFARPEPVHGKLVSTPASFLNLTITLAQRETSWGRGSANTLVHPDGHDVRIPKYAFDILFWKEGLRERIRDGVDWKTVPDVFAIIKTRASRSICINDISLVPRDEKGHQYGRLYSGDVITIWEDRKAQNGAVAHDEGDNHSRELKFVCEFNHGASAHPRPQNIRGFQVEHADFTQ